MLDRVASFRDLQPAANRNAEVEFVDDPRQFRRLVVLGAATELVTLGFYRFWLATGIRRLLWSGTIVEGEELTYDGHGRELFRGFLLAVGMLVPFYLFSFLAGIEAERTKSSASLPLGLAFIAFRQFATYRARRYRLHRTSWRGIRFGMSGSGWRFALIALRRNSLTMATLGAALPWSQAALERYKMSHTKFGDLEGRFVGTGRELFARGWGLWAALLTALTLIALLAATGPKSAGGLIALIFTVIVGAPFWYATFKAIEWKWWLDGLRIGDMEVSSNLPRGALVGAYWSFVGFAILSIAAGALVKTGVTLLLTKTGVVLPPAHGAPAPAALVATWGFSYLVTLLGIGVGRRLFLIRKVWAIVCASVTIHGIEKADAVSARPGSANALGEGFADSLDLFGF